MPACKIAYATRVPAHPELTFRSAWSLFMLLIALLVMAAPVRADETYVCENGRTVTVRFGELEKAARTDPCLARYMAGRSPSLARSLMPAALANPEPATPAVPVEVPLPVRKPPVVQARSAVQEAPPHAASDIIVHYEAPPTGSAQRVDDGVLRPRVQQVVFPHAPNHFYSDETLPAGPVDFRRVPIINAAPGEPRIFHHTR